eukprot:113600_1
MAAQDKTEGYTNTQTSTDRVTISCPELSSKTYHFRLSQVTKQTLSTAFGISQSKSFFLVDANDNIEFELSNGQFELMTSMKYEVQISDSHLKKEQKSEEHGVADLSVQLLNIRVAGNEDGRTTAMEWFMTVHGSMGKDRRDQITFYAITHCDATKKGIWKFHPFQSDNHANLYTIQLCKVSDNRTVGRDHWLAVHGSIGTDKRDNASMYVLITPESQKATIWELIPVKDNYYIRVHGNKDNRKTAIGHLLAVHSSNKNDKRDSASFMLHARVDDKKATQWAIHV